MNCVFFVTGLDSGGIENYLLRFLTYKAESFDQIYVFCKGGKAGQLEMKYKAIPNVIIHVKKISFFNPKDYIYIYKFFKKYNIDVVCDFTGNFAGVILLTAKWAGVNKRISFYRGATNHFKETKFRLFYNNFVQKMTYQYATDILSNSIAAFDYFYPNQWKTDSRFAVIYNGIDSRPFIEEDKTLREELNIPSSAFVIGHTGRFNEAKNHHTIIEVATLICKKYDDIYFLLCGNDVKDNLEAQVISKQLHDKVILLNYRSDIPRVLNTMDVFFFPSLTEGQPNALIEAMIMGLPFVASDIAPIQETVANNTQLFEPKDVDAFVKALEDLYLMRAKRDHNLKENTMMKFDYKMRFDEFYNKLL
ncbi:MAG: glycosyltransferase [Bacteroidetes bacterium]|nr:glycosyltransferase [Bacteroidota bacterium]